MTSPGKKGWQHWLVFSNRPVPRGTIKLHYYRWRQEQGWPIRCDNQDCAFHTSPLMWNGKPFLPVLDHISGNRFDNRPKNLRFLCVLCDWQLPTRGGANKGRVADLADDKFTLVSKDAKRDLHFLVEAAKFSVEGHAAFLHVSGAADDEAPSKPQEADD